MENIIHTRYAKRFAFDGLHITSNLNGEGIKARYGERFYSRLKEMFNIIHLPGKDRRG
jgi:hypothetical protein